MLTVLDLFSGIGGFSLELERTGGFKTVAFCETDPYCRQVLAKHWPDVPCHEDITKTEFQYGQADVICGGFPCQDISNAGNGAGLSGERSGLWRELVRAIRLVRPLYAIVENVASLLGRGMGSVLGDLAENGYDAEWDCIPAQAVGAPHRRDRVWIAAYPNGQRRLQPGWAFEEVRRRTCDSPPAFDGWKDPWPEALSQIQRMDDGPSDRLDKAGIDATGNAVVPQIPEMIGNAILAAEAECQNWNAA